MASAASGPKPAHFHVLNFVALDVDVPQRPDNLLLGEYQPVVSNENEIVSQRALEEVPILLDLGCGQIVLQVVDLIAQLGIDLVRGRSLSSRRL